MTPHVVEATVVKPGKIVIIFEPVIRNNAKCLDVWGVFADLKTFYASLHLAYSGNEVARVVGMEIKPDKTYCFGDGWEFVAQLHNLHAEPFSF